MAQDFRRGFWALADQAVVSLGHFGVNIVLARHFAGQHELGKYGAFWLLMELMFFLNGVQSALLVYPLTIRGAALDRNALGTTANRVLVLTLFAAPVLILGMIVTAFVAHIPVTVGLWAGVALLFWQFQETTRRALMAHLRFRAACIGDTINYAGQFALIALLSHRNSLDLQHAFQSIALTSAAACLIQMMQLGLRRVELRGLFVFARECWGIGKWVLFGNLTNLCNGALFNWNFAYWIGLEKLGVYYAIVNLIRPTHPLAFAVGTIITPNAAKVLQTEGMRRATKVAIRFTLLGAILLLPYLALLLMFPTLSLALYYGRDSSYMPYASIVQIAAVAALFVYLGIASGSFLNGVGRVRAAFAGQVAYATGFLLFAMPMTAFAGLHGAASGWLVAAGLCAAVNLYFAHRSQEGDAASPVNRHDRGRHRVSQAPDTSVSVEPCGSESPPPQPQM